MSGGEFDRRGSARPWQPASAKTRGEPQQPFEQDLLESVLQRTSSVSDSDEPLESAEREALEEVARRHRGRPLVLDPVVLALVEAVLSVQFPSQSGPSQAWRAAAGRIAEILFDDPASRQRLEQFWARLSEGVS